MSRKIIGVTVVTPMKPEAVIKKTEQAEAIADAKKAGTDAQENLNAHMSKKSNPHGVTPSQIGASETGHTHAKSEITDFPTSMTPTAHNQAASTITAGTFAGQVVANGSGQTYSTSLLRNTKLVSADTNPTVNGEICWTYK